ncbi:MAG: transglutaminase-like cysteine peptidase [Pedobacter sp.]|nr:transglutaminase-like cysteine peptidase [Pedobacter sp.]
MKRLPRSLKLMFAGAGLTALFACAIFEVQPSLKKNYTLALVHPLEHSFESTWQEKMSEASQVDDQEEAILRSSQDGHVVKWRNKLDKLKGRSQLAQLVLVNSMVNESVHYISDYQHWSRIDRWGYPYETLVEGGDCEDFAILKSESLRYLGWPEDSFHVLIGFSKITAPPGPHSVLLVTMKNGAQVILDSAESHIVLPNEDHHFYAMYAVTRSSLYQVAHLKGDEPPPFQPALGGRAARRHMALRLELIRMGTAGQATTVAVPQMAAVTPTAASARNRIE